MPQPFDLPRASLFPALARFTSGSRPYEYIPGIFASRLKLRQPLDGKDYLWDPKEQLLGFVRT